MDSNDFDERVVPDCVPYSVWQDHINRYAFASKYVTKKVILDVACGSGYGSESVSNYADFVVGVDISRDALIYAKKKYGHRNNLVFILSDASSLPLQDNFFDTVISFETLEHLDNVKVFLKGILAVLKNNGFLIISTPNGKAFSKELGKPLNPFHVREYSLKEFKSLLRHFENIQIYGQKYFTLNVIFLRFFNFTLPTKIKKIYAKYCKRTKETEKTSVSSGDLNSHYRVKPLINIYPLYFPRFFIAVVQKLKEMGTN